MKYRSLQKSSCPMRFMKRQRCLDGRDESMKWLVIYDGGKQEIVEADDLYDIYNKCGSDVAVAVQLNSNVVAKSYE